MEWRAMAAVMFPVCSRVIPDRRCRAFKPASHFQSAVSKRRVMVRCAKEDPTTGMRKDWLLDDEHALEAELQQAIQSEDYAKAAIVRDRLRGVQQDGVTGVLEANARFYRAFEQGDLATMRKMWKKGDNVHCVHPGAGRISGHELVISSWEVMLGPEVDFPLRIRLEHVEVRVRGDLGYVTCLEVVRSGTSWGKQVATNVFERQDGVWQICMHHASPAPDS
ncbi:F-box protein SKIP8 [Selaginella moellendorffii]|nr:F-box protein SKIP8 [Selaginella moellendorffii]|eukprot:XP_024515280.1 F-box protein SKIP8 [Selaginella moellendorffii]